MHLPLLLLTLALAPSPEHAFDEANALKEGSACLEAVLRYEELLNDLPDGSDLWAPARYNQAVCFEELGNAEGALQGHGEVADDPTAPAALRRDARFREATLLTVLEQDRRARRAWNQLLRLSPDTPDREIAEVHIARLDLRGGRRRLAARRLSRVVPVLEAAEAVERREDVSVHLAAAAVAMGDLVAQEAVAVRPRGTPKRVRGQLERMAEVVEAAQVYYLDGMRRQHPTWAAAAALHLGDLFVASRDLLQDLSTRLDPRRPGWSEPEVRAMRVWLDERLDPLLLKARQSLRLCADIPVTTGEANRFSDRCAERLAGPPF